MCVCLFIARVEMKQVALIPSTYTIYDVCKNLALATNVERSFRRAHGVFAKSCIKNRKSTMKALEVPNNLHQMCAWLVCVCVCQRGGWDTRASTLSILPERNRTMALPTTRINFLHHEDNFWWFDVVTTLMNNMSFRFAYALYRNQVVYLETECWISVTATGWHT